MGEIFIYNLNFFCLLNYFTIIGIVQLVERSIHIAQVVGSNPISGLYKILIKFYTKNVKNFKN